MDNAPCVILKCSSVSRTVPFVARKTNASSNSLIVSVVICACNVVHRHRLTWPILVIPFSSGGNRTDVSWCVNKPSYMSVISLSDSSSVEKKNSSFIFDFLLCPSRSLVFSFEVQSERLNLDRLNLDFRQK